jgi:hypothetical protein
MNITDEPVSDELMGNIRACADNALRVLGDLGKADPATIVNAIDEFAYQWQKGNRPSTEVVEDGEEARLIPGSLRREQLAKQFGWRWAKVSFHDEDDASTIGVLSPDRSLVIYPLDYMQAALICRMSTLRSCCPLICFWRTRSQRWNREATATSWREWPTLFPGVDRC